jgi:hypothetical protein
VLTALVLTPFLLASPGPVVPQASGQEGMSVDDARTALNKALDHLVASQGADGSFGTGVMESLQEYGFSVESFYAWKIASSALSCLALIRAPETPERQAALEKGIMWLCTTRPPARGNDWDNDALWGALYGFVFCTEAYGHKRLPQDVKWYRGIEAAGKRFGMLLGKNQSINGGFGYYDFPSATQQPKWDTSFCTALVLPALRAGEMLDWIADPGLLRRSQKYVSRCALPNGAYSYDLRMIPRVGGESIDAVKGSLGRIQVCNWALASVGEKKITKDRIREGLENFFKHHRFLDAARMRPIPHEAYYANAGYFYLFGHYYAAEAIELLPQEEREGWHARLRPHVVRAQRKDGSAADFLTVSYDALACTAFVALALELGLPSRAD